ncbi:hypothetical protein PFISCL1PPCAC_25069 [Pristionchus fissidentatus]|uniref:Uncharacterized protein n=1 Tax=Pristionchus fissidentatus TaxID=1538716 RepID=A0AAV5WP28_9BILA|nr:hypothetical protein PFISCL1PPCAC_25069 [Pristionchus fissidentatus]
MRKSFRRARCDVLKFQCDAIKFGPQTPIDQTIVDVITAPFDFDALRILFEKMYRPAVMNVALRSGRPIRSLAFWNCSLDPLFVTGLPRTTHLQVLQAYQHGQGFSDEQLLEIVSREHSIVSLGACNLSEESTLPHLIKLFSSIRHMERIEFNVPSWYFEQFLTSLGLRVEGNKIINDQSGNSIQLDIHGWFTLVYSKGYMRVTPMRAISVHKLDITRVALSDEFNHYPLCRIDTILL